MQHKEPGRHCTNKYSGCRYWARPSWPCSGRLNIPAMRLIHSSGKKYQKVNSKPQTHQSHLHHWPYLGLEIFQKVQSSDSFFTCLLTMLQPPRDEHSVGPCRQSHTHLLKNLLATRSCVLGQHTEDLGLPSETWGPNSG